MAISGTIYFFVGFGMALIICIVLPTIPKVLNDAIKQIKSEQQKLKENEKLLSPKGNNILNKHNGGKTKCQEEIEQDHQVEVKDHEMEEDKVKEELVGKELGKKLEERKGIVNNNPF